MKKIEKLAYIRASELRKNLGIKLPEARSTFVAPRKIKRFRCVEGEMFRFYESTGKYHRYDFMETESGATLK